MYKRIFLILLVYLVAQCKSDHGLQSSVVRSMVEGSITLNAPSFNVGETIDITIILSNKSDENIFLLKHDKFAQKIIPLSKDGNNFKASIPAAQNTIAGLTSFTLIGNGKVIDRKEIYINAGIAEDKLEAFIGPKTLFTNDKQGGMLVAISRDQYGNVIENGSSTIFSGSSTDKRIKEEAINQNLLAFMIIPNLKKPGKVIIGGKSGNAFLPEQTLEIESHSPFDVDFEVMKIFPYADERQNVHIKTSEVKDKEGHSVADGSMLTFLIEDDRGKKSMYQGYTVSGIVNIYLQNPPYPTEWQILIEEDESPNRQILNVKFNSNVNDIPYSIKNGQLNIGPVKGALDQLVPDGSILKIQGNCDSQEILLSLELEYGMGSIPLEKICNNMFEGKLTLNGFSKRINISNE